MMPGVAVHAGAIDFSAFTRPAPAPLVPRAVPDTTRRIWIITGSVILALLVLGGIFCCIVLGLMHRTNQKRKKRNLNLPVQNATHRYQPVQNHELNEYRVAELQTENNGLGYKPELPTYGNEVANVHQLDGFIAPPRPIAQPAELPHHTIGERPGRV